MIDYLLNLFRLSLFLVIHLLIILFLSYHLYYNFYHQYLIYHSLIHIFYICNHSRFLHNMNSYFSNPNINIHDHHHIHRNIDLLMKNYNKLFFLHLNIYIYDSLLIKYNHILQNLLLFFVILMYIIHSFLILRLVHDIILFLKYL